MDAFWILVLLIVLSGYFALAEMALASSRRSRLVPLAENGDHRAAQALAIKDNPSRLLAATQTGITAAALLSGVFGESALNDTIVGWISRWLPFIVEYQSEIALTVTIIVVTAFSIVFGEIVPKRIAIAHPENVAAVLIRQLSVGQAVLAGGRSKARLQRSVSGIPWIYGPDGATLHQELRNLGIL